MEKNNGLIRAVCLVALLVLTGCVSSPRSGASSSTNTDSGILLEKSFVFSVLQHVYRWHFDQSFFLEEGPAKTLEVWARRVYPDRDPEDDSEFAEVWIPAVNMLVELKRSDYQIPEMNLHVVDSVFKIQRVSRQRRPPDARAAYQVGSYASSEVQEYLFATRSQQPVVSESLRGAARSLIVDYLTRAYPEPFTETQIFYVAPISTVSNDLWVFWETGRKLLLFSADMDLAHPGFAECSLLRMDVINLDTDVVTSSKEVPGSNAFVTKDWVGRMFYNCILYGERMERTPEQINSMRTGFIHRWE